MYRVELDTCLKKLRYTVKKFNLTSSYFSSSFFSIVESLICYHMKTIAEIRLIQLILRFGRKKETPSPKLVQYLQTGYFIITNFRWFEMLVLFFSRQEHLIEWHLAKKSVAFKHKQTKNTKEKDSLYFIKSVLIHMQGLKAKFTPKWKTIHIFSPFSCSEHVLHEFLSSVEHIRRYSEECFHSNK